MSQHHVSFKDLPEGGEKFDPAKASKVIGIFGALGVIGLLGSAYYAFGTHGDTQKGFAYSWLYAIFLAFTFVAGGTFWILLHNASNSGWGVSVRRLFENLGVLALPLGIMALPLLIPGVQNTLWEWFGSHRAHPGYEALHHAAESDPHLHPLVAKYGFLNITFWSVRFVLYFGILWFISTKLRSYFLKQEIDGSIKHTVYAREFACLVLLPFGLTITFAAVDWIMALDYTWFSTMWGVYHFAGCAWSSMAAMLLLVIYLRSLGYLQKVVTGEHFHLMGKLLFAFTVFWAYIAFSQYFLIWYANIPEETRFYFIRNTGGWNKLSMFLVVGHFVVPFVFLLQQQLKKNPKFIGFWAAWVIFMHFLDIYWNVIPERAHSLGIDPAPGSDTPWLAGAWVGDILAVCAVIGTLGYIYLRSLGKHSLYAWRDPRLLESANVRN
jgi:hypothetical protein